MTSSAFEHLSPTWPQRAAWGTAQRLRAWQQQALDLYLSRAPRDFLAVATPGAGKTTFALRIAKELLTSREVQQLIVVCPTEHLKVQWAEAAAKVFIHLDPSLGADKRHRSQQFDGLCTTYAGVAAKPYYFRAKTEQRNTLVIFDEIHHAGDARAWGEATLESFQPARRRLALTGTPFRSDDSPIPFIRYEPAPDGSRVSDPDYVYGYADALRDAVVRPVLFMAYGGPMQWKTRAGDVMSANLGEPLTKDLTNQAWRTALDPKGEWISSVLKAADTRLTEVRRHMPDAGGLVIASDQSLARAYAKILHALIGEKPTLVLSDTPGSSKKIEEFAASEDRWLVAVRMVSEGVDVPRLAVGVYATATQTPLFFAQAVGRFVRSRRKGETATVFLPTVPTLLSHASLLEKQRDHVIGKPKQSDGLWDESEAELAAANRTRDVADALLDEWELLGSEAQFDHVLFDAQAYGLAANPGDADEADWLGLPGLLDAEQVAVVLADKQRRQVARQDRKAKPEVSLHRALETQRRELNSLVAQYARASGTPHSHIHAQLRRECGGPELAKCSVDQVQARIRKCRGWLLG